MRLLIVVPEQDRATGNWVTATRLQQGLTGRGHLASVCATDGDPARLAAAADAMQPDLALLLHAWRSGRPWLATGLALPFAVLLTGTDINTGIADPVQGPVITTVLQRAAAILSQNALTVDQLRRERPQLTGKIHHLPPGITLGDQHYALPEQLSSVSGALRLLCPAGIRPVKGVSELLGLCDPLVAEGRPLRLILCGPLLDDDYGRRFLDAVAARPWATWLGIVPPGAMPSLMRQVDVIVNNSSSEGLSNALVEAAVLGRPVVARDIPGNAAVITDGDNGLLYRDAAGFQSAIRRLQDDPALAAALSRPAPERFTPAQEIATLETLCRESRAAR